jgi:DNA-binding CsgD family transcriptional regulator
MRSPARPAFKPSERRQFSQLLPQLNCAIALAYELECARQREACALAMLEQANFGFLVLSPDGMPLHGNRLAFELLEQARVRVGQRLRLPTRLLQSRFDAALAHAGIPGQPGTTLLAPGPPPVIMTLRPAAPGALSGGSLPATLTLTLRGQRAVARLPDCVAQHFGLTPAEFRLCTALAGGASLKACAREWSRSYDTLRSQLKTVLAKTGTHRQVELIALLNAFKTP